MHYSYKGKLEIFKPRTHTITRGAICRTMGTEMGDFGISQDNLHNNKRRLKALRLQHGPLHMPSAHYLLKIYSQTTETPPKCRRLPAAKNP